GELGLVVVDRPAQQRGRRVDHAPAPRRQPIDAVAGAVPQRDARRAALAVAPVEDAAAHRRILLHRIGEQLDLVGCEQAARIGEALVVELGHLRGREDVGHDLLVLWTAERVDLGGAEARLGQYAARVLTESCDLGTTLQWRTRETERWRRRLVSAGAVLEGAERAPMRD